MNIYTGYVYIWYDTKAKLFYLGGHKGKIEDSYVCSSRTMKRAYTKRPETFRFRVLQYIIGTNEDLRIAEQNWSNKIKDKELMLSENVKNNTCRYYNVKKNSVGGNGIGTNKGNSNIGGHNKGIVGVYKHDEPTKKECLILKKRTTQTTQIKHSST